jgi:hypothetical protein
MHLSAQGRDRRFILRCRNGYYDNPWKYFWRNQEYRLSVAITAYVFFFLPKQGGTA